MVPTWQSKMRINHFILIFLLLAAVQPVEIMADEKAEHDAYRKNLLKEVLDEDRRISSLAMFNPGFSYLPGNSPRDYVRAYMWFTISAARYKANAFGSSNLGDPIAMQTDWSPI